MNLKDIQASISKWGRETFGVSTAQQVALRMNCEVAELLNGFAHEDELPPQGEEREAWTAAQIDECADIGIMLVQVANYLGGDLDAAMAAKMAKNRNRTWGRTASGKVQHTNVEEPPAPASFSGLLELGAKLRTEIDASRVTPAAVIVDLEVVDGPGEEDGPWAAGWEGRSKSGPDPFVIDAGEVVAPPSPPESGKAGDIWQPTPDAPRLYLDWAQERWLDLDRWYAIGDTGHLYTPEGFPTSGAALTWAQGPEGRKVGVDDDVGIPEYSEERAEWINNGGGVCIFKGEDMRHFWSINGEPDPLDPPRTITVNKEGVTS